MEERRRDRASRREARPPPEMRIGFWTMMWSVVEAGYSVGERTWWGQEVREVVLNEVVILDAQIMVF